MTVARFTNPARAQAALSALWGSGIRAELLDQGLRGLDWFYLPVLGGLRLRVPAIQESEAKEILAAECPEGVDAADEEYLDARRRRIRLSVLVALVLVLALWLLPFSPGLGL